MMLQTIVTGAIHFYAGIFCFKRCCFSFPQDKYDRLYRAEIVYRSKIKKGVFTYGKDEKYQSALLTSALSLLLCVSMLIGATFAW